ncbi:chemotaxis response regulator protein-glutamate methylesterase [Immundisolibacter sp.]|uniref:protein-glutamate methylesterase/protein-glutamine glutaminase n=1 Tax=Immundisolibacter sp. TaxID=1934948 RepID=UPI00260B7190|nr:chemotaxis response regulator protein-glutamate methylesterase [Immundisolibacter sp.]MDD3650114.1 chemotaxis response regulator protein-glutamate methylesterase [Immundisolibacter sp.]
MPPKRILVVDDSALMRRLVSRALDGQPDFVVDGTAGDGEAALAAIERRVPDLVTLDVEMPCMDGLATLTHIRQSWPRLPVIMCSSLTARGAAVTLDALTRGASDYVTKPSSATSLDANLKAFGDELARKIRALLRLGEPGQTAVPAAAPVPPRPARAGRHRPRLLAIGASTGGPNALAEVLRYLPADLPVPVVIAQHMPPVFTRLLAERLSGICRLPVREGSEGTPLRPGAVWLAPGDHHMLIGSRNGQPELHLDQGPPVNFCRPAVDPLLQSAADCYGGDVLALILTGMGRDGQQGCRRLHALGASIYAQDEASSVVWGMPGAVVQAGLAQRVLPLADIGPAIVARLTSAAGEVDRHVG